MDPDQPSPNNQQSTPGRDPFSSLADWQKQAVAGARASAQGQQQPSAGGSQPQPSMPPMGPPTTPSMPVMGTGIPPQMDMGAPRPKSKKPLIFIIIILLAIGLGVGAYFLFFREDNTSVNDAVEESQSQVEENAAIDISTLASATINAPEDMSGYQRRDENSATTLTSYSNEDGSCEISFGTAPSSAMPGATSEEIVNTSLDAIRDAGATVVGPTAGPALVLRDATDQSVTYTLPTLAFEFFREQTYAKMYLSIAILGNGDRVMVSRLCSNNSGQSVPDSELEPLEAKVSELTVTRGQ